MTDTTTAEIKLLKMWHTDGYGLRARGTDGSTHAYETEDGRFRVYRPESGRITDGWSIEDTGIWVWHYGSHYSRQSGQVVVENDYLSVFASLAAAKRWIAVAAAERQPNGESRFATREEAQVAGDLARAQAREERMARERAKAEADRQPTRGPLTLRQVMAPLGEYKIENGFGTVGAAQTIGDARAFEVAGEMLALLERIQAVDGLAAALAAEIADCTARARGK